MLEDIVKYAPVWALAISMGVLVWKAVEYMAIRKQENRNKQFENLHKIISVISKGKDNEDRDLKHASSIAYIIELQNFPYCKEAINAALISLLKDWKKATLKDKEKLEDVIYIELKSAVCVTFKKLKLKTPCDI